jgi:DNA-binding PadR family transcriptional regulator
MSSLKRLGRYEQLILRSLGLAPRSLYDVYQQISNIYRGFSVVASSNIYTLAKGLEEEGLIQSLCDHPVRSKRLYSLTDEGSRVLSVYIQLERRVAMVLESPDTLVG